MPTALGSQLHSTRLTLPSRSAAAQPSRYFVVPPLVPFGAPWLRSQSARLTPSPPEWNGKAVVGTGAAGLRAAGAGAAGFGAAGAVAVGAGVAVGAAGVAVGTTAGLRWSTRRV